MAKKAVILVLDSFGIGSAPDADKFGDTGANTFASIAKVFNAQKGRQLRLPNLAKLGLVKAGMAASSGVQAEVEDALTVVGAY
ncbi:MAG TPA: phosphopentomutase, partial [Rheinheimera sp.]|nr:phosphopentomutase [Rheinheimera sp.]